MTAAGNPPVADPAGSSSYYQTPSAGRNSPEPCRRGRQRKSTHARQSASTTHAPSRCAAATPGNPVVAHSKGTRRAIDLTSSGRRPNAHLASDGGSVGHAHTTRHPGGHLVPASSAFAGVGPVGDAGRVPAHRDQGSSGRGGRVRRVGRIRNPVWKAPRTTVNICARPLFRAPDRRLTPRFRRSVRCTHEHFFGASRRLTAVFRDPFARTLPVVAVGLFLVRTDQWPGRRHAGGRGRWLRR
jgi:hypothetical protein